ncbi:unnamed protein product [Lactuca virosa]|uniref:Uncharacterized protein n=1 Tax=Lactuca virosa TaxID=75947 RepID=A0AAU9PMF3_9ASTR|nr:unnamed protein product [Lactuca virosa]
MCERATRRAVYARILIEMSANAPWAKEIKIKAFMAKGATSTSLGAPTLIPREVDKEGFLTFKRRIRASHIPKQKVQVDNRKGKGPALKIAQVYKPIIRDPKEKNASSNMFDALSHQRVDDTEEDSSIPPVILSKDTLPASDSHPRSSHGSHISTPVDQG